MSCTIRLSAFYRHQATSRLLSDNRIDHQYLLDLLFIRSFRFGVGAAGVATSISQTISALLALHQLMTQSGPCRVDLRKIRFQPQILKMIIKFGLPSGLQSRPVERHYSIIHKFLWQKCNWPASDLTARSKAAFLPVTCFTMALTTFVAKIWEQKSIKKIKAGVRFGTICHAGFGGRVGDFAVRVLASADWSVRQHACNWSVSALQEHTSAVDSFPRGFYARDGCRHARSREGNDSDDNHDDLLVCRQGICLSLSECFIGDSGDLLGLSVDVDAQFVGISAVLPRT